MQIATKSNLVLTDFSSLRWLNGIQEPIRHTASYQQIRHSLVKGKYVNRVFDNLGKKLVTLAQNAYTLRQIEQLEEVSQILMNLPMPEYRSIGLYYHALVLKRKGQIPLAKSLLENVADRGPIQYRTQALLSLGTLTLEGGDIPSALSFYLDSMNLSSRTDFVTSVRTLKMIAVAKAIDGNHPGAVADLEKLFPAVRVASAHQPEFVYDYLNSLTLELGEVGRISEAGNVSNILLASPYINAYPEWRETGNEIALRGYKSRSLVPITETIPGNIFRLPEPKPSDTPIQKGRARIFDIRKWQKKMKKEPNGENQDENIDQMDLNDLIVKLLQVTVYEGVDERKLRKVVKSAIEIMEEKG